MTDLIHLNGPPGIGKSTLAARYVAEHHQVLDCDIDVLRTLIGGWSQDFGGAGLLIRPAALAMIETYLAGGHDVVLPQMLLDPGQVRLFEDAATRAGARFVERFLMDDPEHVVGRFHRRGDGEEAHAWHTQVRDIVTAQGGDETLLDCHHRLEALLDLRPHAVVIRTREGEVDEAYRGLVDSLTSD
ncbi:MAG: AAA family ATPase [Nocardioides sp.]